MYKNLPFILKTGIDFLQCIDVRVGGKLQWNIAKSPTTQLLE